MQADPEYLREYYSTLSDEALLAVERADLIEMAQAFYDAEMSKRGLALRRNARPPGGRSALPSEPPEPAGGDEGHYEGDEEDEGDPEWLSDAVEVYSVDLVTTNLDEERVADARHILESAGIPCYAELIELSAEERRPAPATHRWRVLVPEYLNLRAMSTLERDLSNPDFEAGWRTQLEACSDQELPSMHPQIVFCGLFDRLDRVTRAYEEEIGRRGLKVESN